MTPLISNAAYNKRTRVVNGYEPKLRPWMALIEMHGKNTKGQRTRTSQCGGAILNKVIFSYLF